MRVSTSVLAVTASVFLFGSAQGAEVSELSRDDFYGGQYYHQALEDPRIQKLSSDKKKIRRIAKNMRWKSKKLKKAIEKFESVDGDINALAIENVKKALESTRVNGRVLNVLLNTEKADHVVLYVTWKAKQHTDTLKEASAIAHAVSQSLPFVSTLSLSAKHPGGKDASVWEGKIGYQSMERISPKRIDDYADRLYARLFEGVKSRPF